MRPAKNTLIAISVALALTACGREDAASYLIDGSRHSLSLLRDKPFAWSSGWDLSLVTTNIPDCMRRNKLMHSSDKKFKVELYRTFDGAYILNQNDNWFVTEIQKCQLQKFKSPPPEPGKLLGTFEDKDGRLQFVALAKSATISPDRPTAPPTTK